MSLAARINRIFCSPEYLGQRLLAAVRKDDTPRGRRRIQALIDAGASWTPHEFASSENALMVAVRYNHTVSFSLMMKSLQDKSSLDLQNNKGETALCIAIEKKMNAQALQLINAGANPNGAGGKSTPPLQLALAAGDCAIATALIKAGANTTPPQGVSYLITATKSRSLHALIPNFLNANSLLEKDKSGATALFHAVRENGLDAVKKLLDGGAAINATDVWGDIPLTNACSVEMARHLIEKGADLFYLNRKKEPVNVAAARTGYAGSDVISYLEETMRDIRAAKEERERNIARRREEKEHRLNQALITGLPTEKEIVIDTPRMAFKKSRPRTQGH